MGQYDDANFRVSYVVQPSLHCAVFPRSSQLSAHFAGVFFFAKSHPFLNASFEEDALHFVEIRLPPSTTVGRTARMMSAPTPPWRTRADRGRIVVHMLCVCDERGEGGESQ